MDLNSIVQSFAQAAGGDSPSVSSAPSTGIPSIIDSFKSAAEEPAKQSDVPAKLQQAVEHYSQNADKYWGPGSESYINERMPLTGTVLGLANIARTYNASQNLDSGKYTDSDVDLVAQHMARQKYESGKSDAQGYADMLTRVPGLVAEFALSGGATAGIKEAVGAKVTKLAGESAVAGLASRATGFAAQTAAQAALTPSMYLTRAAENNVEQNRHPLDPRGLPVSYGIAASQMAVLGIVGGQTGKVFEGSGLGQALGRTAVQAISGPFAQGAADAVDYGLGLQTNYGALDKLIHGDTGGAMKQVTMDALNFAAFGAAHEIVTGGAGVKHYDTLQTYQRVLKEMSERGVTKDAAGEALLEPSTILRTLIKNDPNATRSQAEAAMQDLPEGPVRDWELAIARTLPEKSEAAPVPTEAPAKAPPVSPAPEAVQKAPETPVVEPKLPGTVPVAYKDVPEKARTEFEALTAKRDAATSLKTPEGDAEALATGKRISELVLEQPGLRETSVMSTPRKVNEPQAEGEQPADQRIANLEARIAKGKEDGANTTRMEEMLAKLKSKSYLQGMRDRMAANKVKTPEQPTQATREAHDFTNYQPPTNHELAGLNKEESYIHDQLMIEGKPLRQVAEETGWSHETIRTRGTEANRKLGILNKDGSPMTPAQVGKDHALAVKEEAARFGVNLDANEVRHDPKEVAAQFDKQVDRKEARLERWGAFLEKAGKRGTITPEQHDSFAARIRAGEEPPGYAGAKRKPVEPASVLSGDSGELQQNPPRRHGEQQASDAGGVPGGASGQRSPTSASGAAGAAETGNELISPKIAPEEHADVVQNVKRAGYSESEATGLVRQVENEVAQQLQKEIGAAGPSGEGSQPGGEAGSGAPSGPGTPGTPGDQPAGGAGPTGDIVKRAPGIFFHRGGPGRTSARGKLTSEAATAAAAITVPPGKEESVGAGILRQANAAKDQRSIQEGRALYGLEAFSHGYIDAQKDPLTKSMRFLEFFGPIEKGKIAGMADGAFKTGAEAYKRIKDVYTAALEARELIQSTIDNHVGHLWKDPTNPNASPEEIAAKLGSKRPLAGKEGFRKQRVIDNFEAGFKAGLEPVDWNPAVYARKEFDQYSQSIFGHDSVNESITTGLAQKVKLGEKPPAGWRTLPDKLFKSMAPGLAKVKEYFDAKQMAGLEKFADDLGIRRERVMTGLGRATGKTETGPRDTVTTKFGSPEEILAHEIGHVIDSRYGMSDWLKDPLISKELENLAMERTNGRPTGEYKDYLLSPPERMANLVAAYLHAPELLNKIAPNSMAHFEALLGAHKELRPLRDIKPSLQLGMREQSMRLAGPMLTANLYMPDKVATLFENHMSPGLNGMQGWKGSTYRAFRGFGNQMTQFSLGLSGFHAVTTAVNAQNSAIAEAMGMISRGDLPSVSKTLEAIIPGLAAGRGIYQASGIRQAMESPGAGTPEQREMAQYLAEAGSTSRAGKDYMGEHFEQFQKAIRMIKAGDYSQTIPAMRHLLPALNQLASKPLMEHMVPLVKLSVASDAIRYELSKNPDMNIGQRRELFGKIGDAMDDRFGLVRYDNLFLNRMVRDGLQTAFLSAGWNLGDVRGLGGGAVDVFKPSQWKQLSEGAGLSRRTAFLAATMVGTAMYGTMYQLLATGKLPEETKDLFFPRNGQKNKDGTDSRISIPGYMKDVYAIANRMSDDPAVQPVRNAWSMTKAKIAPAVKMVGDLLENQDWQGKAIDNPNDPAYKRYYDDAQHILNAFVPISIKSYQQQKEKGAGLGQQLQGFAGFTTAPSHVMHTTEEQRQADLRRKVTVNPLQKKIKADSK